MKLRPALSLLAFTGCVSVYTSERQVSEQPPPTSNGEWLVPAAAHAERITISAGDLKPSPAEGIFDRVADAVVSIRGSRSRGTGFLITRDGLALTNHHLIERQDRLTAELRDGRTVAVRVLRSDPGSDVALIELPCGSRCSTVSLGADEKVTVGSDVYIIGTPLSDYLSHTLTKGIVSGLRSRKGVGRIQTDAAINPGSSGGPIVDAATGRVIGIVSSKLVGGDVEGIGFGTAISDALSILGVEMAAGGGDGRRASASLYLPRNSPIGASGSM